MNKNINNNVTNTCVFKIQNLVLVIFKNTGHKVEVPIVFHFVLTFSFLFEGNSRNKFSVYLSVHLLDFLGVDIDP